MSFTADLSKALQAVERTMLDGLSASLLHRAAAAATCPRDRASLERLARLAAQRESAIEDLIRVEYDGVL